MKKYIALLLVMIMALSMVACGGSKAPATDAPAADAPAADAVTEAIEAVVEEGEVDVLISFERLEALRYLHFLKKGGVLIVNDCRIDPMTVVTGSAQYPENIIDTLQNSCKTIVIDGLKIAKELGNTKVLNSVVLGASAKYIGFTEEEWLNVLEKTVPPKTVGINKKAFLAGFNA